MRKFIITVCVAAAAVAVALYVYRQYKEHQALANPRFYSGNGRLEATEVYISAKLAGRIEKLYVDEGDLVHKGDKLVQMQTNVLEAQRAATLGRIKAAEGALAEARASVKLMESSFAGAEKEYNRQKSLIEKNATSQQLYDAAETNYNIALDELETAKAKVLIAEGDLEERKGCLQEIDENIKDSTLYARYDGRIQYVLAREGEIMSAGGRVLNQVNLTDAYMTFFLPTDIVGKVRMGSHAKLLFDAAPDYPFDATITYIDPVAQFTPKSVETRVERVKLMFRLKASLRADLLDKYIQDVKTGLPGVAWVKLDPMAGWEEAPNKVIAANSAAAENDKNRGIIAPLEAK